MIKCAQLNFNFFVPHRNRTPALVLAPTREVMVTYPFRHFATQSRCHIDQYNRVSNQVGDVWRLLPPIVVTRCTQRSPATARQHASINVVAAVNWMCEVVSWGCRGLTRRVRAVFVFVVVLDGR